MSVTLWDSVKMLELGEIGQTGGKLGEGWAWGGWEWDHRPISRLATAGSRIPQVGEYWRYLSAWVWGLDDLWCLIGKWKSGFIWGVGMKDLGWWTEGWGFGFVWRHVAQKKKIGKFDWWKWFAKCTVGRRLEGGRYGTWCWQANPQQWERHWPLPPAQFLKGRTLWLGLSRVGHWNLRVGHWSLKGRHLGGWHLKL